MSTTKPSVELPRSLPYVDAPDVYDLADLTNLIIGDTIWSLRKQTRMSETKLAEAVNRRRSFVRLVESGQHSTTIAEFKSLAKALNLDHLEFAKEVLSEIVMASEAITSIAEPGVSLIEPRTQVDKQDDAEEVAQEDAQEDSKECAQDDTEGDSQECVHTDVEEDAEACLQENAKKEKGTYRRTFRNRRKMPPKESKEDTKVDRANVQANAQDNAAGADPEGPAPVDE